MLYPIAWGLCEGGNVISPNDEAVFYGCLDMIAKPVFSIALLYGHWNIDPARLGLKLPQPGDERSNGIGHGEKRTVGDNNGVGHDNGVADGDHHA